MFLSKHQKFIKERDAALEAGDIDWARQWAKKNTPLISDRAIVAGFHKVRAAHAGLSPESRAESLQWLKDNGYKEMGAPSLAEYKA